MSVGSIVSVVAGKIGEVLLQEANLLYGVKGQVQSLQQELTMMSNFVIDMEEQHEEGGDRRTHTMIKEIRNIVYDAEDLIESYVLEASSPDKKKETFFRRYFFFCCKLSRRHQVGSEIEAIKVRIAETMENWKKYRGDRYGVSANAGEGPKRYRRRTPIASPHTIEEHVVGLEEDINKLVEVLTVDEAQIKMIAIVGMGGSGKSTLSRKLFNHERVKKHFDSMAWVAISELWDTKQILLELLRISSGETVTKDEAQSVGAIVEKLSRYLEYKRYLGLILIVLDDVWTKQALEEIFPALHPSKKDGRKIIITTRKQEVVDFPDLKCLLHEPRRLTDDESWELFTKIVRIHKSELDFCVFEELGKKMLKKCEGLPLAVVALAGILAKKETLEEWEKVEKAVSSRIMEQGRGTHLYGPVKEMLALSYTDLPSELKPCFLHLATFREDSKIDTTMLCRMWIAEGFITSDQLRDGDTLEDVAREYLEELILRCVVQVVRRNYRGVVKTIRMHDLVRDLCIKKAKEQDFLEILSSNTSNSNETATKLRRVAIYSYLRVFPTKSQHLRSLVCFCSFATENITQVLTFRLLRVLFLSTDMVPTEIGCLINLRYLGIWVPFFANGLPSSIGNLRNLVTLDYRNPPAGFGSDKLEIPDVLWKLSSLRHISLPTHENVNIKHHEVKLHALKHLQILKGVRGGSWMVEELPRLSPSVQELDIRGIESEEQLEAAFRCPSISLDHLHSLTLGWYYDHIDDPLSLQKRSHHQPDDVVLPRNKLRPIVPCQHLRKLHLRGRILERWERGVNIQFPTCLNKIILYETMLEAEATLAGLGKLPNLTSLALLYRSYEGTKWSCSATEFPQLKELKLVQLEELKEWSIERGSAMPVLTKLHVEHCRQLRRLPRGLKFISTLHELHFIRMNGEFYNSIEKGGEDAQLIQHVPRITIKYW